MIHRKPRVFLLVPPVVLSVAILSCSAVANLPNPFATPTSTATATFTPTVTPSPTPTSTPTATPLPTGMTIQKQPAGGTLFYDYDGGYSINIPAEWLVVQIDPDDVQDAVSTLSRTNPELAAPINAAQEAKPSLYRIIAYDKQADHHVKGYVTNFTVGSFNDDMALSMPLDLLIEISIENAKEQIPGLKAKQLETRVNAQGIPIGSAEMETPIKLSSGGQIAVYQKLLFFRTDKALLVITFSVPKSKAQLALPSFDAIFDGIKAIEQ